ncbi:MAG: ketoacyl-ACP synthase III [Elusimicrobiota bacterium]|jgi:3-oxoacyl-[acyl-carrier-protein] synthase-3
MAKIIGTGMHLPQKLVTNEEMFARFGRDPWEKVYKRIGHGARYHSAPDEHSGHHALKAARAALAAAKTRAEEIDLIVLATDTPAFLSPGTSSFVQHELGAKNAGTFDVNCACAGFVTAMDVAGKYLEGADEQYRTALVIGTYAMSKFLDPKDPGCYTLFGDGAGAVVLRRDPAARFHGSTLSADGQYWDYMGIYGGGSAAPASPEVLTQGTQYVRVLKKFPPTLNFDLWPPLIEKTLAKAKLKMEEVDLFVFTQIRRQTIEDIMKKYALPMEKAHTVMEKWGYTGSACIPMVLHDAIAQGKLQRGQKVVFCASGGGFAMASLALTY